MDSDTPLAILIFAIFLALPFVCTKIVDSKLSVLGSRLRGVVAGALPTLVVILALVVWDIQARAEHAKTPEDGFMSPLLLLLYGFPLFLGYLIFSFVIAFRVKNSK